MIKKIAIILILVLTGSPVAAQEDPAPSTSHNRYTRADWNPCLGEGDSCYVWQGKLEHCQSASVSFHFSLYNMEVGQISVILDDFEVMKPGNPGVVRKVARLAPKAPGYLRVHDDPMIISLESGCKLELPGLGVGFGLIGSPHGKLICNITFEDGNQSWTAEIGSADIKFRRVPELPPLTTE